MERLRKALLVASWLLLGAFLVVFLGHAVPSALLCRDVLTGGRYEGLGAVAPYYETVVAAPALVLSAFLAWAAKEPKRAAYWWTWIASALATAIFLLAPT